MTCPQIDTLIDQNCKVYVKNKKIFVMQFHYCIMLCVRNFCIQPVLVQKVVHGDIFRAGVNSAPELEFLANSNSNSGIELA